MEEWKEVLKSDSLDKGLPSMREINEWLFETGSIVASHPLMPEVLRNKIERGILMGRATQALGDNLKAKRVEAQLNKLKQMVG
jgi:hypothetical protein|tara:strand:- start:47 stop:295 length:249 start_codon:yes stop_codon:yes gene_type:complete